jgi:hypothetical protein
MWSPRILSKTPIHVTCGHKVQGTAFADFESFLSSMKSRGVSFLEMLAMELKNEGKYVARGLSFLAAEFSHVPCKLTSDQVWQ